MATVQKSVQYVPDWLYQPLLLEPRLIPKPWGGNRLSDKLGLPSSAEPIGEAWLLSDHPIHKSRVTNVESGRYTLGELVLHWPEAILGYPASRFPLLIKIVDACENLSIQVHPDDTTAKHLAPNEGGKTEAWLILEARENALIYLGLRRGIDRETLVRELVRGAIHLCLNTFRAKPGDCYYIPAGTIHALGAGVCVLEVQQSSDATFRLYDWGRVDIQGKPRPLHIEAGIAALREPNPEAGPQQALQLDSAWEQLIKCPYFSMYRLSWSGQQALATPGILIPLSHEIAVEARHRYFSVRPTYAGLFPAILNRVTLVSRCTAQVIWITWPMPDIAA
ncbi:MAG: hypothetical protein RMI91_03040 [Gemmatales bacterium]|nr:class I mannose-6-phosphate isomerase [Gemmatales bacterium]MDW7993605.1 hypothetical protein [Gemmatales bacterium]